jgi:hypothetical protein
MNIRFYIDKETGLPHIYNHEVDEVEVEEVLQNSGEDRAGRDDSRIASVKPKLDAIYGSSMFQILNPTASL